ncbi:MAG TPA: hypothetical protein PLY87_13815 [Planctomycetaceae bacterium]|nr:hypothetical protein [Planctomycetaceae bacterium]HQZ66158.1 hypothetical protein [Planctomycetaceae bacterium]
MFNGLLMICLIPFFASAEQNHMSTTGMLAGDNQVAIHLDGDIAREYVRLVRSQEISDAFLRNGSVVIEGSVDTSGDGTVRLRHFALVRVVGEPVRLLRLESMIDANQVLHQNTVNVGMVSTAASYRVNLSDLFSSELRSSLILGDFSNTRSYR